MKTNLERLLDGEEAVRNGYKIIDVLKAKHKNNKNILILYGDNTSIWFSKEDINRPDFCAFTNPPKQRTIKDGLKYGDVISDGEIESKVIGVCGDAIIIVRDDELVSTYLLKTLIGLGYKLIQPESKDDLATEILKKHWDKNVPDKPFTETHAHHLKYAIDAINEALNIGKK